MKILASIFFLVLSSPAFAQLTVDTALPGAADVPLFDAQHTAGIYFDSKDAAVVKISAGLLADDVQRVCGKRPSVASQTSDLGTDAILIGTVGHSALIDQLIAQKKIDASAIQNQWEASLWQTVLDPVPGVHKALVIAGSDRRGTAYGVVELSQKLGVSPWYWWADVPTQQQSQMRVTGGSFVFKSPAVKYRGIFINDEDFGIRPWATKTLDPESPGMGPKTYAKVFELMLRLKMNYLWPAMHSGPGSSEFSFFPGNAACADEWAIVTGSSHCEPMLRNNLFWPKSNGAWRYDINRDAIFNYWKESATTHANYESVWTVGIRGIHDAPMQGPKDLLQRVSMVEHTITDERSLVDRYVSKKFGTPAEVFIPYKEVLPLYNAGMKVPDDVTLMWPDDNYGYVRRLATTDERKRSGGSGVYYHFSYWGGPHSYLWVESTPPGLAWEELYKSYVNDSKAMWIVNVGDIKPAETCIDFFSRLAWNPSDWGPDAQNKFLSDFDAKTFGSAGPAVMDLQNLYYRIASQRKPEAIGYGWVDSQPVSVEAQYRHLFEEEKKVAEMVPADRRDAYFEMVGYAARMLAASGQLYSGDEAQAKHWKKYVDEQTDFYNNKLASGKWHGMMSETMEGLQWPEEVGGKAKAVKRSETRPAEPQTVVVDASSFKNNPPGGVGWKPVAGLGWSGSAMTLIPAVVGPEPDLNLVTSAPSLVHEFETQSADGKILIHALPTIRLTPESHLRIGVSLDDQKPVIMDIPGGDSDSEQSKQRHETVQVNRSTVVVPDVTAGKHTLKIYSVDPGVVLDQVEFPK